MHTFRAWVDARGFNRDREHDRDCLIRRAGCRHLRLFDLDTDACHGVLRVLRRRRPRHLAVRVGPHYWPVLRLGRRP